MALRIDYDADGSPAWGPIANGSGTLNTCWDELPTLGALDGHWWHV
jgi:hypothetical protein